MYTQLSQLKGSKESFYLAEKEMKNIPVFLPGEFYGQRSPMGLQSMGSQGVGHNWSDLARTHTW